MIRNIIKLLLLVTVTASFKDESHSGSFKFNSNSTLGFYQKAAVASNVKECAQIGSDILKYKNGSAVDAAIAVLICEGVTAPISMGLGGGFLMTIYDAPNGRVSFLNAKETAPGLANANMYHRNFRLAYSGGLAVAVPGQLLGYWEAHKKYGRAAWKDLFEPSIELCKSGFNLNDYNSKRHESNEDVIRDEPTLAEVFVDPDTNKLYNEADKIKQLKLGETLRKIADAPNPAQLFYRGQIAEDLVNDIRSFGGIITAEDFANYKVKWHKPIRAEIDNMTIYTSPPPGSGSLLTFMLNVLKGLVPAKNDKTLWQRLIETYKWAFAKRADLGDPDFVNTDEVVANLTSLEYADAVRSLIIESDRTHEDPKYYKSVSFTRNDAGTGHVSVLAPDGSAVAVTSTINQDFGAKIRSRSTGIILNDQMDDFGSPGIINYYNVTPSPNNFIQPNKRPLSSISPTIVLNKSGKVQLIIGSSGGTKIPTTVATVMALYFWNGYNLKEAIDAYRLHHQLLPMRIQSEAGFPGEILEYLQKLGHKYFISTDVGSAVTAIARKNELIAANVDYRRGGGTAGF